MAWVLKTRIENPGADFAAFHACRTMYGGKRVAAGDPVFLIDSETRGGAGLAARGRVSSAFLRPRRPDVARQTPLVDLEIRIEARVRRPLGRSDLKPFAEWDDGRPETELNFKLYRQATDKLVGISDAAAAFLDGFF